jgi:hypothetical protein
VLDSVTKVVSVFVRFSLYMNAIASCFF